MYADRRILETYYSDMALHLDYMVSCSKNFIRYGWGYGDWLSVGEVTDVPAMNTAFLAYDAHLMEKIAGVLGKKEDEKKFAKLFDNIKAAFNKEFVEKDGRIINYTQTIYVMALKFDLLTAQNRKKAAKYLAENIGEKGGHLATGFVGVGYLLSMLSEEGYNDLAYQLITNTTYPSWGYSIVNGATTIWERWNSYTKEQGFGDVGMNSFNHYSLGSCGEWLYRYAAGIREDDDAPGFSHIIIKPYINKAFGFVKCRYMSIRGEIVSNWTLDEALTLEVSIPANTTATIWVPARKDAEILENGVTIAKAEGLKLKGYRDGYAVLEAVSGAYRFSVAQ